MLFLDLLIGPTLWAIKFHHKAATLFIGKLVDAVFIAVEWQKA
ncbi:Uncharacterised protein [Vibrio cholerae]|nr:Uncharacterised protein [Vibrio cholerae]